MAWHIFGVLQVAISVKVVQLEELTVNRLKSICSTDNIYNVLNDAANLGLECIPAHCLLQLKMITPNSGLLTVNSGCSALFTSRTKGITLKHAIGGDNENVSIDLKRISTLNYLEMELAEGDWSYWIAVSTDNVEWTRIIDYSDFICRSVQRLFFKERQVRYIRICGTAPANGIFEILRLKTYRSTELFEVDTQTGIVIPSENVALTKKNAVVIQGENEFGGMLNGRTSSGWTYHEIGKDPIIVQLPQPYLLDTINLVLLGRSSYSYSIDISIDKVNWTRVLSEEEEQEWRHVNFDKQPVVFIKLNGTYNTFYNKLYVNHLECPAIT